MKTKIFTLLFLVLSICFAYANDEFVLVSTQNGSTVGLTSLSSQQVLEYSVDGIQWQSMTTGTSVTLNNGDSIFVRGQLSGANSKTDFTQFTLSGSIVAKGNINYLWDYENLNAPLKEFCGACLFRECVGLKDASLLTFPAADLTTSCYWNMFNNCTGLTAAPQLKATKLAERCYDSMFNGCTSLAKAPALPAFDLALWCYNCMFFGCSSLTTAPSLPASALVKGCYYKMFKSCSNLKYIKCLATDIAADSCLIEWVRSIASSGTFVRHEQMTSWPSGNNGIPSAWTKSSVTPYTIRFDANGGTIPADGNMGNTPNKHATGLSIDRTSGYVIVYGENTAFNGMLNDCPSREGHTFLGWYTSKTDGVQVYDNTGSHIVGAYWSADGKWIGSAGLQLYAQWQAHTFTIMWKQDDGTQIDQTTVEYGQVPTHAEPSKEATDEFTYTFAGWTPNIVAVTGDATYTATYNATRRSYTITWLQDDGTQIDQTTVEYGQVPTHAEPNKVATDEFTYTFAGWTPNVVAVTGDATYTATYNATRRSYTITWKQDDGTQIDQTTVEYGQVPTHADPTKEEDEEYTYTFAGWTPTIVAVTGEATYTATYNAVKKPEGLEDMNISPSVQKIVRDGQVLILRGDKTYTLTGQEVK